MLSTIQDMKFFLCTGFGDSKEYAGRMAKRHRDYAKEMGRHQQVGQLLVLQSFKPTEGRDMELIFVAQFPGGQYTWQEPFLLTIRTLNTFK